MTYDSINLLKKIIASREQKTIAFAPP